MPKPPPDLVPQLVRGDLTEQQLQGYLATGEVAVDTETLGLQLLRDRLCLVQLCNRAGRGTLVQFLRASLDPAKPQRLSLPGNGHRRLVGIDLLLRLVQRLDRLAQMELAL